MKFEMNLEGRYNQVRNQLDDWNMEDAFTLRKAIELKRVSAKWEEGFLHLARLQLLALEFDYDILLKKIYQHMLFRSANFIKDWSRRIEEPDMEDLRMLFQNEPVLYHEGNENYVLYNVNKCKYEQKLKIKYSENVDMINDMVNQDWL